MNEVQVDVDQVGVALPRIVDLAAYHDVVVHTFSAVCGALAGLLLMAPRYFPNNRAVTVGISLWTVSIVLWEILPAPAAVSGIGVLDKSVTVLQAVSTRPCNLAELCRATGLPARPRTGSPSGWSHTG